jgi:hypothetical protein
MFNAHRAEPDNIEALRLRGELRQTGADELAMTDTQRRRRAATATLRPPSTESPRKNWQYRSAHTPRVVAKSIISDKST